MNAPTPADAELLSSYLDGEARPDEVARIEADAALMARVGELRAARDLMATPVDPPAADDIDRLIGRALGASETSTVVTDLGAARARRPDRTRTIAAVAAAVALIALAVPVLNYAVDLDGGDRETADTATAASGGDDTTAGAESSNDAAGGDEEDRSLEASALPAEDLDRAADDTAADDAADDTLFSEAPDPSLDTNEGAAASTTVPVGALFLYKIEAVTNNAELSEAVRDGFDEFSADAEAPYAARSNALADAALQVCADVVLVELAERGPAIVDLDVLGVAGTSTVVVVLELADGEVVLVVTPLDDCDPVEVLPF